MDCGLRQSWSSHEDGRRKKGGEKEREEGSGESKKQEAVTLYQIHIRLSYVLSAQKRRRDVKT